jgi:hypothetical protein
MANRSTALLGHFWKLLNTRDDRDRTDGLCWSGLSSTSMNRRSRRWSSDTGRWDRPVDDLIPVALTNRPELSA